MYARHSHGYTHLILALGIVRKPTIWGFITLQYPGIHGIDLPSLSRVETLPDAELCRSNGEIRQANLALLI